MSLTSKQRMLNLFVGDPVDRLPVQPIVMTFAARFAGIRYYDYVTDYRALVEAQLRTVEMFELDVITLCSDPCREAADCGAEVRWFDDQPPAHDPNHALIQSKEQLFQMRQPDPLGGGRMHDRVKGASLSHDRVGGSIPILGWVEGPMAEAVDLRGFTLMMDVVDDPDFVIDLMEFVTEMEITFARAQIKAGVDIMGIGDAAASLIGPEAYRTFVLPYERRLIEAIQQMGCPVRLHICGNIDHLLKDIVGLGVDMIDIDFLTDLHRVREVFPEETPILGNVEPVRYLLDGTPEEVYQAFAECHRIIGKHYVVGPGCEVPPLSPQENVREMVRYAHQEAP